MSPKPSKTSLKADELATFVREQIEFRNPGLWTVVWDSAQSLQRLLWKRFNAEEKNRVVLTAKDGKLNIVVTQYPKKKSKITTYRELLRRAMVHIDDEKLYDEIMEAVHGNN